MLQCSVCKHNSQFCVSSTFCYKLPHGSQLDNHFSAAPICQLLRRAMHSRYQTQPTPTTQNRGTQKSHFYVMLVASGATYLKGVPSKLNSRRTFGHGVGTMGGKGVPIHFTLQSTCAERRKRVSCIQHPPRFFSLTLFFLTPETTRWCLTSSIARSEAEKDSPNTLLYYEMSRGVLG